MGPSDGMCMRNVQKLKGSVIAEGAYEAKATVRQDSRPTFWLPRGEPGSEHL